MSVMDHVSLAESPADKMTELTRIVASSAIGTAVEWYDWLCYGTASALVFNKLFFPLSDPALGTIAAFGTTPSVTWPAPWAQRSSDTLATGSVGRRCSR
jgi:MHS family shikimate/dehydroshikimate transporter-like MFS transporter